VHLNYLLSEQLFNCSDIYACFHRQLAPQTPNLDPTFAAFGSPRRARLPHRTLSALRQARLPLCLGSGSWSQILSVGQLPQGSPAAPISLPAAARPGPGVDPELSARARSVGTDMRHQSRTPTPPGKSLSDAVGGLADRSSAGGTSRRHHAAGLPSGRGEFGRVCFATPHPL